VKGRSWKRKIWCKKEPTSVPKTSAEQKSITAARRAGRRQNKQDMKDVVFRRGKNG